MIRLPDWEPRLHSYLGSVMTAPFVWGQHDCALFVGSVVEALTGVDPASAYRGRYNNETGARLALKRIGKKTLLATFDDAFGASVAPAFAGRGDIVLTTDGNAGVCMGGFAFLVGAAGGVDGLVRVARPDWARAWRI